LHSLLLSDSKIADGKRLGILQKTLSGFVREIPKGQKEKWSCDLGESSTL